MSNPLSASAQMVNNTVSMVESFWAPFLNVGGLTFVVGLWVLLYVIHVLKYWDQSSSECTTAGPNPGWCYKTIDTLENIITAIISITVIIVFGALLANGLSRNGIKPKAFTQAFGVLSFFYLLYLIFMQWSNLLENGISGSTLGSLTFGDVTKRQIHDIITAYSTTPVASQSVYIVLVALLLVVARAVA